jgi:pSer/pThr/pTyr-binding forkhead associated (FHA) protein
LVVWRSPARRVIARDDRRAGRQRTRGVVPGIESGPTAGTRIELVKEITTAGRHENSDLLLDDVSVSRHHAIFTRTASGRITLRDLNSLNGTYVNGARVEETTLHSADEVQIGKFKLVFWEATQ